MPLVRPILAQISTQYRKHRASCTSPTTNSHALARLLCLQQKLRQPPSFGRRSAQLPKAGSSQGFQPTLLTAGTNLPELRPRKLPLDLQLNHALRKRSCLRAVTLAGQTHPVQNSGIVCKEGGEQAMRRSWFSGVDHAYGSMKRWLEPMRTNWEGAEGICWLCVAPADQLLSCKQLR